MMVQLGQLTEAATICQNRGFAAARKGDLPAALALLDQGESPLPGAGCPAPGRGADPGQRSGLRRAVPRCPPGGRRHGGRVPRGGDELYLAEGLLLLADVALLNDDPKASHVAAEEAARLFDHQQKPGWGSLARAAIAHAGLAAGLESAALADLASAAAEHLDEMRLADQATMAHSVAGRLWLATGDAVTGTSRTGASRLETPAGAPPLADWQPGKRWAAPAWPGATGAGP